MVSELKLAEMLCTRLCHDLTGPIGAVNNGAEFLEEEGFDMQHDAVDLILSSATEAVHRLQFYRQAYGRVNDSGEASLSEKKQLVEDFFSSSKVKVDWPDNHADASGVSVSQKMARLILNAIIIVSGALLKGGTLSVRITSQDEQKDVVLRAVGDVVRLDEDVARILRGEAKLGTLTPKTAQLALVLKLLEELDAHLTLVLDDGQCELHLVQKVVSDAVLSAV